VLDRHTLSSRRKTVAAIASQVLISALTSPSLDITLPKWVNLSTYSMFPCATAIGCGDERWVISMAFVFFPAYIQFNLCSLFFELGSHLLAYVFFLCRYRYVISEVQIR